MPREAQAKCQDWLPEVYGEEPIAAQFSEALEGALRDEAQRSGADWAKWTIPVYDPASCRLSVHSKAEFTKPVRDFAARTVDARFKQDRDELTGFPVQAGAEEEEDSLFRGTVSAKLSAGFRITKITLGAPAAESASCVVKHPKLYKSLSDIAGRVAATHGVKAHMVPRTRQADKLLGREGTSKFPEQCVEFRDGDGL
eukprot:gene11414-2153_t